MGMRHGPSAPNIRESYGLLKANSCRFAERTPLGGIGGKQGLIR